MSFKSAFSSILISLIPFTVTFLPIQKVSAQITPDSSLGDESSVVNQLNQLKSLIEGGAVRGENLFHSFQEFNVGNGQSVYFVNPDGVNNILTRVTGENISQILGTLGVNGNGNLFLINPNGFMFGNGAKLDLNGSFTATTGDIQLGEDGVFSAADTQGSSLLSVKPEALFRNAQGQIENRASLVVRDGQNIILMADKVVNKGNLTAPGGIVKLEGGLKPSLQPDTTLGTENTQIETMNENNDRVIGGAERGVNLFHSFLEFNIETGKGVYFANPVGIENILARVTGDNTSEILGTLGVLGNANLFFLNPNGILLGPNASLDLSGSFIGTTANSFTFADGSEFSATNPDVAPLLTVNGQQPISLRFEGEQGAINNAADLAVASRQTLSLSGSNVATTGNLTAPAGRVEVLGTETVALLEDATIDVSAPAGGGTVLIGGDFQGRGVVPNAKRTYVGDNVTINADALTNGNGGKVIVWADEVTGFYGNISARGGIDSGNGGLVEVSGKEHLIFRGNVNTSAVNGLPGILLLDPTNITIADGRRR